MTNVTPPISLAGSRLGDTRHVCAFFHSDDEEYRVLLPFIKDGFHCGDKAIHVVRPDARGEDAFALRGVARTWCHSPSVLADGSGEENSQRLRRF
jgi:hypothetical protein